MSPTQIQKNIGGALSAAILAAGLASFSGVASADSVVLVSPNEEASGFFGFCVAGIPDCDGDGHDDVVVGASGENGGGVSKAGRAYIYSGATGLLIRGRSSPNERGLESHPSCPRARTFCLRPDRRPSGREEEHAVYDPGSIHSARMRRRPRLGFVEVKGAHCEPRTTEVRSR
ncbi:MAG: integrin alpha [Phycisphaerae bacterium]|nr:integrin alpha [Phycisphaerae bacterium]